MKKFISLFLFLSISFFSFSQNLKFPQYYIQNGDTIGVIYSIEQSQKIYNDNILLELFKDVNVGCDSLMKKYYLLVNKYGQKQIINEFLVEQYEKDKKEQTIILDKNLAKIDNLNLDLQKCGEQLVLKTNQYENDEEIISTLKCHRGWLLGGTIGFGVLSIFLAGAYFGK